MHSHDDDHLRGVLYKIAYWSIYTQAQYADVICTHNADLADFCEEQLQQMPIKVTFFNATSIGNLAYMALHAHPAYVDKFHQCYMVFLEQAKDISDKQRKRTVWERLTTCCNAFV